jgi:hypothetical protein
VRSAGAPPFPAKVLEALAYARRVDDGPGLLTYLAQLLGTCPASGARAATLAKVSS